MVVAKSMNVKKANTIINEISETVKNWNTFAEQVNVDEKLKREIGKAHLIL